ncbi:hypothetical protein FGSG_08893 [Fusarium graminearum PH-1]|uniref:Chromosome 2, complete genome n=1 Tax=Gibberella zeae (strain ATCC MYA-4620 / CBS 123657 / FGSC 9075 / NRRL 31084 / PH-1) TaxID=229533 RepID=I1RX44_GIBZE|nr:hypothetical protein FGSG_08893 [Fusarium graminearum PH-1]ESU14389.1 hypothetical protein FGSG_08893 [Fusarium graminearum PH-1]CAF3664890.1 unnamed protein product [Fusarium graminearum]CEF77354.1 unnamed protein product [Fusarium graminearum]|eukprot:XP_011319814.1 hypothetical protein FGSG_08893 [Fusarium graminearum PH-1]
MSTLMLMSPASSTPCVYQTAWTSEHIDSVFQCLVPKEKQTLKFVEISIELYGQMDQGARAALANLFMVEFGKPVLYAHDIKKGCWYLGVASDLIADGGMLLNAHGAINALFFQRPKPETTRPRIPRPPNAYILYRKERHQIVKGKRPGITNNEISQVLGRCWNMEHPDIRTYYKKMADDIKEEHKRLYPDYQYRPRKSRERRRRSVPHTVPHVSSAQVPAAQPTHQPQFSIPSQIVYPAQVLAAAVAAQQNNV